MEELTTTNERVEARDVETVLTDEDATVDELMEVTTGKTDVGEEVYVTTTASDDLNGMLGGVNARDVEIALVVTAGVSLVLALVVFFAIAMKKKAPKSGFMRYLREFLNFRKIWIAGVLKFVYIFLALCLTIGSVVLMFFGGSNVLAVVLLGICMIIFGNILLRLGFEMTMMIIGVWENTRDIRGSLVRKDERPELRERIIEEDDLMEMDEEEEEPEE